MARTLVRFLADDAGATAIEYGMIVALIGLALVAAFVMVGGTNGSIWGGIQNKAVPVFDNVAN
jgi:pilus assembly protein Flp/PilA